MNIRFVSTLTAEDEANFAPALLRAVGSLLDQLPIAYTVRIETSGDQVFQHSHPAADGPYAKRCVRYRLSHHGEALAATLKSYALQVVGNQPARHRQDGLFGYGTTVTAVRALCSVRPHIARIDLDADRLANQINR